MSLKQKASHATQEENQWRRPEPAKTVLWSALSLTGLTLAFFILTGWKPVHPHVFGEHITALSSGEDTFRYLVKKSLYD